MSCGPGARGAPEAQASTATTSKLGYHAQGDRNGPRTQKDRAGISQLQREISELVEAGKVEEARRLLAEALSGHHDENLSGWQKVLAKTKGQPNPDVEPDFDRTPEFLWITEHSEAYRGQWVALLGSELLAHSTSLKEVVAALERNKPPHRAMLHYVEVKLASVLSLIPCQVACSSHPRSRANSS